MPAKNLTVEILKQIRDEMRQTRQDLSQRIDRTNVELTSLRGEVHALRENVDGLEKRQTTTETRLASELIAVVGAVRDLREVLLEDRRLREMVTDHERRLAVVEKKTG